MKEDFTMRFVHAVVFKLRGIILPPETQDRELVIDSDRNIRAVLTNNPDDICIELDRNNALSRLILSTILHANPATLDPSKPEAWTEAVATEVNRLRESRKTDFGDGPCMIVFRDGHVDDYSVAHQREYPDLIIAFDNNSPSPSSPKEAIRQKSSAIINAILTALVMALKNPLSVKKVSEAITFFQNTTKPMYIYTLSCSGSASISTDITHSDIEATSNWYFKLAADTDLVRVTNFLTSSLQTEDDRLRAFLFAWSSLEIFINKIFKAYEERLFKEDKPDDADYQQFLSQYSERKGKIGKYNIADKFNIICYQICNSDQIADSAEFRQAKYMRDYLLHGRDVEENDLPVGTVQKLLRKYLRLHVQA